MLAHLGVVVNHIFNPNFRSVFARLYISVFLALIVFAVCMFGLTQLIHNNSEAPKQRAIARQVASQIDPYLSVTNPSATKQQGSLVQARFSLVAIKESLDFLDSSLNAKIGLYDEQKKLIVQTNNTQLPTQLNHESTWLEDNLPALFGTSFNHVLVKMPSGYTLWYESRTPPKSPSLSPWINIFTGTVLLLLLMAFVLWMIAKNITERLEEMSKKMVQLGDGDFSVRVDAEGNDEIADLAYGFNQAAQKIEQLLNANSLLLAHASHEFRTPITRMRLQTEMIDMLSNYLDDTQRAKLKKRATAINQDLNGLNELIESILLVSRLDAGFSLEAMEQFDLYDLVDLEYRLFLEQNQKISLYGESVAMYAQPKLITHLARNLINNAFIHGIDPVEVYVYGSPNENNARFIPHHLLPSNKTLADGNEMFYQKKPALTNAKFAVLCVLDQGAGIPENKREDIFSPFVRLKQERKGSGLGLSLVAQIVEAHDGHISTDIWQGKTRFLVIIPLKKPTLKRHIRHNQS